MLQSKRWIGSLAAVALAAAVSACPTEMEGDVAGECSDDADNDRDGLFDCDDPDCSGASACDGDDDTEADDDTTVVPDDDDTTAGDDDDTADDDDATADDDDTAADDDTGTAVDADGDGWDETVDCDDSDPALNLDDADADGGSTCDGDCDDGEALLNLLDLDGDGHDTCSGDCDDADATATPVDLDGDGASSCEGDCDDTNPDLGAADGDGDGYSTCDGDCDDGAASVNPGATEVCDGLDSDCDGTVPADEVDGDGDGHTVCGGDCDDGDVDVNPGENEVCSDGVDNDCDGTDNGCALAGTFDLTGADAYIVGADNHDQSGFSVSTAGDLDGDGYDDLVIGAALVDIGTNYSQGAAYVLYGPVSGGISLSTATARLAGESAGDQAGYAVSGGGDINGDGYDDLLVSAVEHADGGAGAGAAYVLYGPVWADMNLYSADAKFVGEAAGDWAGTQVDCRGDVDGDGLDDILIGAATEDSGGEDSGAAYLLYGSQWGEMSLSSADVKLTGAAAGDYSGVSVAFAGDTDGDGRDDVLVGAAATDAGGTDTGTAYLLTSPVPGITPLYSATAVLNGENPHNMAGSSVAAAGDVDGDGYDDVLIGAYGQSDGGSLAGAAYLVLGPMAGSMDLATADARLIGEAAEDFAGSSVAGPGDVDGDGFDDLLIGAPGDDLAAGDAGAVYLLYGPVGGTVGLSGADAKFTGWDAFDAAGQCVSAAGDVDGDGLMDLLIGAPLSGAGGVDAGSTYLVEGSGL